MKKLFTVLAVLLVATALFAGATIKAGGTFGFLILNEKPYEDTEMFVHDWKVKGSGFGFGAGAQYDVADNLAVYGEFNMIFPKDATIEMDGVSIKASEITEQYGEDATYKINSFSISAGVAYKLDFNAVKLAVGGGISFGRTLFEMKGDSFTYVPETAFDIKESLISLGLNALVDAKYMFTENIGAGVTLNPQLGLYNIAKETFKLEGEDAETATSKGFKVSFAMPITVGVSYTF